MQVIRDGAIAALTTVFFFLSPIFGIMILVGGAILLDTITGVWKCKRTGVKVTSKGLQGLISKMFFYQGVVVLLFMLDTFILNDVVALIWDKVPFATTKIIALSLVYIEFKSIDENYEAVKGVSFIGKISRVIKKARKIKENITDFKSNDGEGKTEE